MAYNKKCPPSSAKENGRKANTPKENILFNISIHKKSPEKNIT
jgi:hypothetical protein